MEGYKRLKHFQDSDFFSHLKVIFGEIRARDRVRTGDIQLGRLTLYQLSYSRLSDAKITILYISLKK
jgi:hypothetical protein